MNLRVVDFCGPFCLDPDDGDRLCAVAEQHLAHGGHLCLDFSEVKVIASSFLEPAVGNLYGKFPQQEVDERLTFVGLGPNEADYFRLVQARARLFFSSSPELQDAFLAINKSLLDAD